MKIQLRAIFKGKVQGVFFRKHVLSCAQMFKGKITGYVKNIENGNVEVLAIGEKSDLEEFIKIIKNEAKLAKIQQIEKFYENPKSTFESFDIIY